MLKMIQRGDYKLLETKKQTKILTLDDKETFAWINAMDIGEILVTSHNPHKIDALLAQGKYRLYEVKNEPKYVDQFHLELSVGCGNWQGYLMPYGLPTEEKKRNRIIPTSEVITKTNSCSECNCGC